MITALASGGRCICTQPPTRYDYGYPYLAVLSGGSERVLQAGVESARSGRRRSRLWEEVDAAELSRVPESQAAVTTRGQKERVRRPR